MSFGVIDLTGLTAATFAPKRQIRSAAAGGVGPPQIITATVTIDEQHHDDLTITDHPVEQGATITDHAFKQPAQCVVTMAWSAGDAAVFGNGDPNYLRAKYELLLQLQASRAPFDLFTGKRDYQNMLIKSLSTHTDEKTENILRIQVVCRQVILVNTQVVTIPADQSLQADPKATASPGDLGTQQPKPVALDDGFFSDSGTAFGP